MTLTQAARITKISFFTIVIVSVLGIIGGIGYNIWHQNYLASLPKTIEAPQNLFGDLPPLSFPKNTASSSTYTYSLDTVTGGFPDIPNVLKVYFIPPGTVTLLSNQKAKELAEKFGFQSDPEILSDTKHRFLNQDGSILDIDTTTLNFSLQAATDSAQANGTPKEVDPDMVANEFKGHLSQRGLLSENLKNGPTKINFDEINLWPEQLDNLPFISDFANRSLIRAVIQKNSSNQYVFPTINFTNWHIDLATSSTYKVKPAEVAFQELQEGLGAVILNPPKKAVSLSNIYLAYYLPEEYAPYLQPVYVFEGPDFLALVEAIQK